MEKLDNDLEHLHVIRKRHHGVMEKKSLLTGKYIKHEFILYDIERPKKDGTKEVRQELWYIHEGANPALADKIRHLIHVKRVPLLDDLQKYYICIDGATIDDDADCPSVGFVISIPHDSTKYHIRCLSEQEKVKWKKMFDASAKAAELHAAQTLLNEEMDDLKTQIQQSVNKINGYLAANNQSLAVSEIRNKQHLEMRLNASQTKYQQLMKALSSLNDALFDNITGEVVKNTVQLTKDIYDSMGDTETLKKSMSDINAAMTESKEKNQILTSAINTQDDTSKVFSENQNATQEMLNIQQQQRLQAMRHQQMMMNQQILANSRFVGSMPMMNPMAPPMPSIPMYNPQNQMPVQSAQAPLPNTQPKPYPMAHQAMLGNPQAPLHYGQHQQFVHSPVFVPNVPSIPQQQNPQIYGQSLSVETQQAAVQPQAPIVSNAPQQIPQFHPQSPLPVNQQPLQSFEAQRTEQSLSVQVPSFEAQRTEPAQKVQNQGVQDFLKD